MPGYRKDVVDVQREQVRNLKLRDIILLRIEGEARTHPLDFDVDAITCEAVEIALKKCKNITEYWSQFKKRRNAVIRWQSANYRGKIQNSMKTSAFVSYLFYLKFLKFKEDSCQNLIHKGPTILALLSVTFHKKRYNRSKEYFYTTNFQNGITESAL